MNDSLFSVLDEETRNFFENFYVDSTELMLVNYDQNYPVAVVMDKAVMRSLVEALSAVRVAAKTNMSVTDAYNSVCFVTAEGNAFYVSFESSYFHAPIQGTSGQNYEIENDKDFWKLFRSIAEDGWERAQENTAKYESEPVSYSSSVLGENSIPLVACETASVDSKETDDKHWLDTSAILRFTNRNIDHITGVTCRVQFLDNDSYVVDETVIKADFSSAPIAPGESGEHTVQERVFNTSSVVGAAVGGVEGVLVTVTDASMQNIAAPITGTPLFEFLDDPDITAFAEGFYNDPPQTLTVILNWFSSRKSVVTDKETITAAFEALKQVHVGEQGNEMYTDYDTYFRFTYDDGREYTFSFNGGNLMISTDEHPHQKCYRISGGEDLGALIKEYSK